jgi:tripartite-type tricarboxylate transporter receptor subunit TctC
VIAACKANPGAVKYASVGIGTLGHLAMTVLGKKAGVEITHVPYRGGGPAMNDVLGGHVDMIIGSAALITAQLGTNMLRPILQMGRERMPCSRTRRPRSRQASPISRRWPGGAFSRPRTRRPMSSPAWRNR